MKNQISELKKMLLSHYDLIDFERFEIIKMIISGVFLKEFYPFLRLMLTAQFQILNYLFKVLCITALCLLTFILQC